MQTAPPGFGSALYHENGIGYVDLGTWNPSEGTGQLTVALWARYDGQANNWQGLIGKLDSWTPDGCRWILEIRANQVISFIRNGDTVTFPGVTLPEGQWAHVAVTFDGTIQVFYINGEEVGRSEWSLGPATDAGMRFGCDRPNGSNPFHGALDEVMLYNRALSDLEVLDIVSN